MKRWAKTLLIWVVLLAIVYFGLTHSRRNNLTDPTISPGEAIRLIDSGKVQSCELRDGILILYTTDGMRIRVEPMDVQIVVRLRELEIPFAYSNSSWSGKSDDSDVSSILVYIVAGVVIFLSVLYFLRKRAGAQFNTVFELRKSKARSVSDTDKAKFGDIGGNREAVEMLADIVDFLRAPERWKAACARLPRGVLLVGPPGTGKTLLARAVAGETKAAFFYTSATEFVELFVGVGPARIRDTFEKAAAQKPAVVFIDEIDAVGRRRGSGVGTMHEEREQTLNQLLVLLDGLERHDGLVVMAATNRLDVLDPALLRSGRFDKILRLEMPSLAERIEILKIHTRLKPLEASVSLERIARLTDGLTGADLESLTNDAALSAVRRFRNSNQGQEAVSLTDKDFDRALDAMTRTNRHFDRLDSILVESVSQFAEPTGKASVRVTMNTGTILEGDIVWMNAVQIKLRLLDGSDVVIAKALAEQIVSREGTERTPQGDFAPDRWAGRNPESG